MKKWNIFIVFIAALFALFSCAGEIEIDPIIKPVDNGNDEVTFSIQVPGHKKPIVYTATEADENIISELEILAFAKQDISTDTLAYRITVDTGDISDAVGAESGNTKNIKVKLKRNSSNIRLVFIANAGSILDAANIKDGDKMDDVLTKLSYDFEGKWSTNPMRPFPMWGQTSNYISVMNSSPTTPVNVSLLRCVAKVDVAVDKYGDPAIGFGSLFKLKHVYVYNPKNKGYIVPVLTDPGLTDNKVNYPNIPSDASVIQDFQEYEVLGNAFENEIYLPESGKASPDHTFLIIGGSYDGGAETYYRIDFVNNKNEKLDLLRNYRYLVNITNVARAGFASKMEALTSKTSHINYTLGVTDENIKSIVYNGQYMLGVSDSDVSHNWDGSINNTIAVATDYQTNWTATTDVSWITLTVSSGGINGHIVYNIARNDDDSGLIRTGKIIVTAGSLTQEINVTQSLGSNSFLVLPGQTAQIPALFANADGNKRVTEGMYYTAELLWEDEIGVVSSVSLNGTGKNTIIDIATGNTKGNAVVALKNGNEILWSWHIWVTDYNPLLLNNQKQYNGVVFMDRNLGAIVNYSDKDGLGLLYQWGRKDPFPGASSVTQNEQRTIYDGSTVLAAINIEKVTVPDNFNNSVANPMTFYTSDEFPWYSWYGLSEANNSLWIDAKGNKTAYDPCPHGWRVPANTEIWSGTTSSLWNNGFALNPDLGYYPATGGMDFSNGKIIEVGTHGYYWTASPSGTKAKVMRITASEISINSTPFRASGNPVRCVKE